MVVFFGSCCSPLPGDPIVGYITRGRGVSVHRADCKNVENLMREEARIIEVEWASEEHSTFTVTIRVRVVDKAGSLLEVSKTLMSLNVNITNLSSRSTEAGDALMDMTFSVSGTEQLRMILSNLQKLPEVIEAYRM